MAETTTAPAVKKKYRFQLVKGTHNEGGRTYFWKDPKNNVVETDVDLVKVCGREKFRRLEGNAEPVPVESPKAPPSVEGDDVFSDMTVAELRRFAEEEEIDLGSASRKEEILSAIRLATRK